MLEKVIERDPGFVSAFYSLGMLYNTYVPHIPRELLAVNSCSS